MSVDDYFSALRDRAGVLMSLVELRSFFLVDVLLLW